MKSIQAEKRTRGIFKLGLLAAAVSLASGTAIAGDDKHSATAEAKAEYREAKLDAKEAYHDAKAEVREEANEAEREAEYADDATRNAWMHGKLETALLLNRHLNNFRIDTKVVGDTAYLNGKVESDIDKNLAEEVARGIDGIAQVANNLIIDRDNARVEREADELDEQGRTLAQRLDDATTTAAIKSKLLMNGNTSGMNIDVDTRNDHVTLKGEVNSSEEKALAGQIAENTDDVDGVDNQLQVRPQS